jgi:hypothetical protein
MPKTVIEDQDEIKPEIKKPVEDRVDEFSINVFAAMGYTGRLPDVLVELYREFKRRKDALTPGRLSPEGFAMVALLFEMAEGRILSKKG